MAQPNYYSIITHDVMFHKDLPPLAKLVYAAISSLTHHKGFCFATNSYIAELFDVSEVTISRSISALVNAGFIAIEGNTTERKMYLTSKHQREYPKTAIVKNDKSGAVSIIKNDNDSYQKRYDTLIKNDKHNSIKEKDKEQQQQTRTSANAPDPFATPPPVARFLTLDEIVDECKTDNEMHMLFHRRQVPLEFYAQYLDAFVPHYKAMNQTANRKDFRSHFLNWSEKRHRASKQGATGGYDTLKRFT
jgi:predicted transcriptional regulator